MYRVLIVDDEPWVLKGIRNTFRWEAYGFEVAAETTDSEHAWHLIKQERPHAVITDIRMPELSGIDLMRMSREEGMDTEFVILSGVADFQYAQDSIRLGCFDYLLKPLQFEETDAVLKRLGEHLQASCRHRQKALREILTQGTEEQIAGLLLDHGFNWQGKELQVLQLDSPSADKLSRAEQWLGAVERLSIQDEPNQAVFILASDERFDSLLESKGLPPEDTRDLFIGVSHRSGCVKDISALIEEARLARQSSFLFPEGGIFRYRKESSAVLRKKVHELCDAVRQSEADMPYPSFESFPELFRQERAGIKDVVYFWNQMVSTLHHPFHEGGLREGLQFMDHEELTQSFANFEQLCNYLKQAASPEVKSQDREINYLINENFRKLLDYVNLHYMEELQLKELSHQFYINYTYCCDLFQKATKSTFTDYITRLRMKKAELLLREGSSTIIEVCQKVGYKDYTYFNKVFKKWYGLTPSNYRKSKVTH